jgi:hypothetical protein
MDTSQTYRLQAELCARQAEYARTQQLRISLLEMAQTWLRLADWAENPSKFATIRAA